ncbi:MAG: hypothetical protein ACYTBX_05305 [Planctomycetota bacterium]
MRQYMTLSLVLILIISTLVSAAQIDLSNATIVVLSPKKKIMTNAADMLGDEIDKRTRITLDVVSHMPQADKVAIIIGTAKELAEKGYRPVAGLEVPSKADGCAIWIDISKRPAPTICTAGHDDRGTLFAVGRLLRLLQMGRDKLKLDSDIKQATAPRYSLRGHQFGYRPKTNSYDAWTLAMWEQYYREMIVFGMNAIELIPPRSDDDNSPHFPKPQLEMMVDMSQLAADYGLDLWIWFPAIDDDYTDQKTVKAAIEEWGEVFRSLPKIDVVFVPGGDPGDTHPAILLPFMKKQKKNLNRYHPKAQIWISPQGFDRRGKNRDGWLKAFLDILQNDGPQWLDGVVFGPQVEMSLPDLRKAVPEKYPIRRYPDITHCRSSQYAVPNWDRACLTTVGREPINPRPLGYTKIFRDLQQYSFGFITYSEGCNDDFNKVLWSCLGWDPDMKVEDVATEYSRYFISPRYEQKFAEGLFGLERNWVGPLKDNDDVYRTLKLFQEMEKNATPQDKLNWRFQQGLYRAYYDAYVKARLYYETELEKQAMEVLNKANQIGALKAVDEAEAILDKAVTEKVRSQWRARAFEMAEALYQSIRMQLSVEKYQAIRINRGANLDEIDKPLNNRRYLKESFDKVRRLKSEKERLEEIAEIID